MANILVLLGYLAMAAVFATAGIAKLADLHGFAYDVHQFALTPWALSKAIGYYLPCLEVLTAMALFIPALRAGALLSTLGMSAVFSGAIFSAWVRKLDLSCGCFGQGTNFSHPLLHLSLTLTLGAVAGWFLRLPPPRLPYFTRT